MKEAPRPAGWLSRVLQLRIHKSGTKARAEGSGNLVHQVARYLYLRAPREATHSLDKNGICQETFAPRSQHAQIFGRNVRGHDARA